jgi:hypothetical protein
MAHRQFSRRQVLVGTSALAVGAGLAPASVLAGQDEQAPGRNKLVRWDLIMVSGGVLLAGGTDVAMDAATGDTIALTGSGQAEAAEGAAGGGGTFVHRDNTGATQASGPYIVTGFRSFANGGGNLGPTGLTDGIGEIEETTGGVLALDVRLFPVGHSPHDAVLTIFCHLPGGEHVEEGIQVEISIEGTDFHFMQDTGSNAFHLLQGGSSE